MKRKARRITHSGKRTFHLDGTEFLLLAFGVLILLTFFGWQNGLLPEFITKALPLVR